MARGKRFAELAPYHLIVVFGDGRASEVLQFQSWQNMYDKAYQLVLRHDEIIRIDLCERRDDKVVTEQQIVRQDQMPALRDFNPADRSATRRRRGKVARERGMTGPG